jgi:hypothetical protein
MAATPFWGADAESALHASRPPTSQGTDIVGDREVLAAHRSPRSHSRKHSRSSKGAALHKIRRPPGVPGTRSKQPSQRRGRPHGSSLSGSGKVQSLPGDHHTVVADPVLRQLGDQAQVDGANGFTFGVLHAPEHATARVLEQQLPAAGAGREPTVGPDPARPETQQWRDKTRLTYDRFDVAPRGYRRTRRPT